MSIETECPKCGKSYRVKDEMAGKRFRCKNCQATVAIPDSTSDGDEDWDEDFLGGLDTAVRSEHRSAAAPPPMPSGGRRKSKGGGKKAKRNSDAGAGLASALKVIGGVVGVGVGFVIGFLVVRALMSGGAGHGPSWQPFSPAAGSYRLEMPSTPGTETVEGRTRYVAETSQVACAVSAKPLPAGDGLTDDEQLEGAATQFRIPAAASTTSERAMQFGDYSGREIQITLDTGGRTLRKTWRLVIAGGVLYILECVDAGSAGAADRDRFFNSFQLLDSSGQPQPADWGGG